MILLATLPDSLPMSLPTAITPILVARDLRKRFGVTEALRGIDFELAPGEIVAVMGPSGSGKSTLLHCLAGILAPDGGTMEFDGRRIDAMSEGERSLGIVGLTLPPLERLTRSASIRHE